MKTKILAAVIGLAAMAFVGSANAQSEKFGWIVNDLLDRSVDFWLGTYDHGSTRIRFKIPSRFQDPGPDVPVAFVGPVMSSLPTGPEHGTNNYNLPLLEPKAW